MNVAYFDCFAGAGGDMVVAALLDAGADRDAFRSELAKLDLGECVVWAEKVRRGGLGGLQFHVDASEGSFPDEACHLGEHDHEHLHDHVHDHEDPHSHEHPHEHDHDDHGHGHGGHDHDHGHPPRRRLSDIVTLIDRAGLAPRVTERARRIFTRLGQAEAKVHRIDIQEVHFHEVGAVDSIVDIVAACIALELLGIDRVVCSAIPVGSGMVRCEHGLLPVPAPAVAELLVGVPLRAIDVQGEATTPTAAAIFVELAESFGPAPEMTVRSVGYGAGTRDNPNLPNLLRVIVGQVAAEGDADELVELAANLDDCTGEVLGHALDRLLACGCVDAWASPAVMKKSRPAWLLSALCRPADVPAAEQVLFAETTTFGVRRRPCRRTKLLRSFETVETVFGPIRVKVGRLGDRVITASPEFADCRTAAETHHASVRDVFAAAGAAWRQKA